MVKSNIVEGPIEAAEWQSSWPPEDCIRWVEWRIRELTIKSGQYIDERGKWLLEEKAAGGRRLAPGDKVADYAVWLLKVRDKLSWHQIAYRFFPFAFRTSLTPICNPKSQPSVVCRTLTAPEMILGAVVRSACVR